ncbi:MAG: threonine/serine ThrE exporter family protein [Burkholderiales bacterium]
MQTEAPEIDTDVLLEFMFRLGQAYLACGDQTAQVELTLRRIAAAYGMRKSRVVAFPTAIFITLHDGTGERVTLSEGATHLLRLDQMADVFALGAEAQNAAVPPSAGIERLSAILRRPARYGAVGSVLGHATLTVGLALVLMPSLLNLAAAAVLGAAVGVLKLFNRERAVLSVPTPVLAAAMVSALVFLAVRYGLEVNPLYLLVPPLVTFLPGAMLAFGMVELAYGDMVSGASRLIAGLVQLLLLAFGLAAGALLVGVGPESLLEWDAKVVEVRWAPWVGTVVFTLGVALHFSAPRNSFGWMLFVVLAAFGAQRLASILFGSEISGFFGTLVAMPLAYLIQLRFKGPPVAVTFLPSFWMLVPGSLGLLSVTRMLSDRTKGLEGLVTVVFAVMSIALGTLVGATLYRWATEKFGWWQLQIGLVSSYLRRQKPPK